MWKVNACPIMIQIICDDQESSLITEIAKRITDSTNGEVIIKMKKADTIDSLKQLGNFI
jgi:hypothetical protein